MSKEPKGRLLGAKFKTFSGAAKRAQAERVYEGKKGFAFTIEGETDSYLLAQGFAWRIRKTKRVLA